MEGHGISRADSCTNKRALPPKIRTLHLQRSLARLTARRRQAPDLCVFSLVAIDALQRRAFALEIFGPVAIDAQPGSSGGIVKGFLPIDLHRRGGRLGMAIGAGFLRHLQRLFRLRWVMADFALARNLEVRGMVKAHSAHRGPLQDDGGLGSFLRL